ncbi:hypothetical protein ACTJKN_05135 [Pedobacter sp. 22163]|uniref:hypothetical protein n=1 Tax=Pedobacter sp. 22163 TaxID=3453883 RepID=UPI003F855C39
MAITILSKPAVFSFAANPITFSLQSDNNILSNGTAFVGYIERSGAWDAGTSFLIRFSDQSVTMTAAASPDLSGNQFTAGAGPLDVIASDFRKNYVLSTNYDITVIGERIYFTAKNKGTDPNWISPIAPLTVVTSGTQRTERSGFKFLFEVILLSVDGNSETKIYSEKLSSDLPFSGTLNIDLHNILTAALDEDVPNPNSYQPMSCPKSMRSYYCQFAEVYDNSVKAVTRSESFHVATGGFSYTAHKFLSPIKFLRPSIPDPKKDIFLKQGEKTSIRIRTDQPEFLYFINLRSSKQVYLKTDIRFMDNSVSVQKIVSINLVQYKKYAFATGYNQQQLAELDPDNTIDHYSCYLVDIDDNQVSEKITYRVDYSYKEVTRYFLYSGSLGSFDTFLANGKGSEDIALTQEQAESILPPTYLLTDGTMQAYNLRIQKNFVINTGWLNKRRFDLLQDFFIAEYKFLAQSGKLFPVLATAKKTGEYKDGNSLIKQDIAVSLSFEDYKFTEGDLDIPVTLDPLPSGTVHYGLCNTIPVTADEVTALPNNQPDSDLEFILPTGTGKTFCIALPAWKKLNTVFDLTSEEDITSEYLAHQSTVMVSGVPYKLYTMMMAVGYSANHEHQAVIIENMDYVPVEPPEDMADFIFFGSTSFKPTTAAHINALANNQSGEVLNVSLSTGTNRYFSVAIPEELDLLEVYDEASEEDITSEYLDNYLRINVNSQWYSVYTMQVAIAYSVSHTHLITLAHL